MLGATSPFPPPSLGSLGRNPLPPSTELPLLGPQKKTRKPKGLTRKTRASHRRPEGLNNLDRLVNWSHEFLNRNQDARIYPVPRDQVIPEGAGAEAGNQGVAYENARGGCVSNL
jgi:hypothetical protein